MERYGAGILVFVCYAGFLTFSAGQTRIGSGAIDSFTHLGAQDEAVYSAAAIGMARSGDWLTPRFLGRPFLYKPPLLYWAAATSVSLFGESARSVRLPSILAAAGVCGLIFWWVWGTAGIWPALLALSLVAGNPFWFAMGQRNMTDALLSACLLLAIWQLWKHGSHAGVGFVIAVSAAILVKSAAGLLPIAILGVVWLVEPKADRAPVRHLAKLAGLIALFTVPWFAFQFIVHPRWFWEEFVKIELLAWGLGSPPQTSHESTLVFYGRRLLAMDPILCVAAAIALFYALRKPNGQKGVVPFAAVAVCTLALFAYSYRNVTYLLPLIPALALAASLYLPRRLAMLLTLAAAAKAALFWPPAARPEPIFRTIESYCSQGRSNDTVIVSAGDQFYSTLLPLRNVRYAFHEAEFPAQGFAVDFRTMGIAVTVDEFLNIDSKIDDYQRRLQEWGVRDSKPIATVVLYRDESELERLIRERAHTDFILVHGHVIRIRYGVLQDAGYPAGPCRM